MFIICFTSDADNIVVRHRFSFLYKENRKIYFAFTSFYNFSCHVLIRFILLLFILVLRPFRSIFSIFFINQNWICYVNFFLGVDDLFLLQSFFFFGLIYWELRTKATRKVSCNFIDKKKRGKGFVNSFFFRFIVE